ncbi:MAG: SAM-dependent DNA methyltransferase [bacterium]
MAQQDFFSFDWKKFFAPLRGEILVLGNPPWVTNAALGVLGSKNLPRKTNFQNHSGFAAKTGKANFDISEWMLIKLLEALGSQRGCVAMLCKTGTARKVLRHAWLNHFKIGRASIHLIDATTHFGASVNACLLVVHTGVPDATPTATVYSDLSFDKKMATFALIARELVADVDEYTRLRDLDGFSSYTWRSGVKHDAASVMEFRKEDASLVNGAGERVEIESTFTYPLLKSSDLANGRLTPYRYVLVTQRTPGDDTNTIAKTAPKTWSYLLRHADVLDRRQSIIYRKRSRFSVFGVGDYTFAPWKVAVSGLYKKCRFEVVRCYKNKPVVLDDTCYFIPCSCEREATFLRDLLNSDLVKRFLSSLVFFDAKRPITIDVLRRIDLKRVAEKLGLESDARKYLRDAGLFERQQGVFAFEKEEKYRTKKSRIGHVTRSR